MDISRYSFPRATILKALTEAVAPISDGNVFCEDRPTATGTPGMNKFAVVRFAGSLVSASSTHCSGHCQFALFAKDVAPGIEDTLALQSMIDRVLALFPIVTPTFSVTNPLLIRGGDDNLGFHAIIIQASILATKSMT